MIKNLLTVSFCVLTAVVSAQPTLTGAANNPSIGESYTYHLFDASTFATPTVGTNQTWDFSSAVSNGPTTSTFVDPATMSQPGSFPASTAGTVDGTSGSEVYYVYNSSTFAIEGIVNPGATVDDYANPREIVKFPITYGNTFSESFSGVQNNIVAGITWNRGGTIEIEATGYGTLELPYGTINNVLMITNVTTYTDVWTSVTINYLDSLMMWYNSTTGSYLASWDQFYYNGSSFSNYGYYLDQADVITSLGEDFVPNYEISLFPNPSTGDQVNIHLISDVHGDYQVDIYDMSGKLVKSIDQLRVGLNNYDLSDLGKGLYYVKFLRDKTLLETQKLIIQ